MTREDYMREALLEAGKALLCDEVPVGAVVVAGDMIIARAHNGMRMGNDATAHAELLAMQLAARQRGGRLQDCTLYVTLEPCAMCAGAAVNYKLNELFFGAYDFRAGCCGSVLDVTDGCAGFAVKVWGGILEEECAGLLTQFFQGKR